MCLTFRLDFCKVLSLSQVLQPEFHKFVVSINSSFQKKKTKKTRSHATINLQLKISQLINCYKTKSKQCMGLVTKNKKFSEPGSNSRQVHYTDFHTNAFGKGMSVSLFPSAMG